LIVPVFEGETPRDAENAPALAALDHLTRGAVSSVFDDGEMTGKRDRYVLLHTAGQFSSKRVLLFGAGSVENIGPLSLGRLAGAAIRTLIKSRGIRSAAFLITRRIESDKFVQAIVEGALIGQTSGCLYGSKDEPEAEIESLVWSADA
jgi:predicted TIM-barrel enzyme